MKTSLPYCLSLIFLTQWVIFITPVSLSAQIDQNKIMPFLNQVSSGRTAAHGGYAIADISTDINHAWFNPAMYQPDGGWHISLNNQFHLLKSNAGNIFTGTELRQSGITVYGGIVYFTSGDIPGYDENGEQMGTFSADDISIVAGASKQLYENMRVGANLKFVTSSYESYHSTAVALDLAAAYHIPESPATFGFAVRNIGTQLTAYSENKEPLPLNIEASASIRLRHLPLRIGLVAHHLQRWNLLYDNPNNLEQSFSFDDPFSEPTIKKYGFVDNVFRHLVLQTELMIGKKEGFKIRLGYNHFRKRELSVNNLRSLSGFSGGIGLRISKFTLDYGLAIYHLAGKTHTLTLTTDLHAWGKKTL